MGTGLCVSVHNPLLIIHTDYFSTSKQSDSCVTAHSYDPNENKFRKITYISISCTRLPLFVLVPAWFHEGKDFACKIAEGVEENTPKCGLPS